MAFSYPWLPTPMKTWHRIQYIYVNWPTTWFTCLLLTYFTNFDPLWKMVSTNLLKFEYILSGHRVEKVPGIRLGSGTVFRISAQVPTDVWHIDEQSWNGSEPRQEHRADRRTGPGEARPAAGCSAKKREYKLRIEHRAKRLWRSRWTGANNSGCCWAIAVGDIVA